MCRIIGIQVEERGNRCIRDIREEVFVDEGSELFLVPVVPNAENDVTWRVIEKYVRDVEARGGEGSARMKRVS